MSDRKIFVSYHFGSDRQLAGQVAQLVESFEYKVVTGEDVGGGELTAEVMQRIDACDALVAIVTKNFKKPGKKAPYVPHPWVMAELGHARAKKIKTIAIYEDGVAVEGPYAENERIAFGAADPSAALIKLARTLSLWRRGDGRTVKVIILPEELGTKVRGKDVRCEYRFRYENWLGEWQQAYVHAEVGGSCAYLQRVKDEYMIELRVSIANETWTSLAAPQWVRVELQKGVA